MKTLPHGSIILAAPSLGPVIARTGINTVDVRLGHDDAQGRPLLVGALPQSLATLPQASRRALYVPWEDLPYAGDNSCVGLFKLDLPWSLDPNLTWLLFLVLAQPADLRPQASSAGPRQCVPLSLALARFKWMKAAGTRPDPRPHLADDIETALATWLGMAPGTRPTFSPLKQPDDQHLLHVRDVEDDLPNEPTRFVLGSCQYPPGMLDHTPANGQWRPSPPDKTLAALDHLRQTPGGAPDFVLLVGDQVYIDETAGLFDPALSADRYGAPYTHWLSQPMAQKALSGLPLHTMLDDHEVTDNWAPLSAQAQGQQADGTPDPHVLLHQIDLLLRGVNSYKTFQGPPGFLPSGLKSPTLWRQVGPANRPGMVFLADTRTERALRHSGNIDAAEIMSENQFSALSAWLARADTGPRFLACPAMVLPRRRWAVGTTPASALYADAWDGYPHSLHRLLATLHTHRCQHIILLSGDEHLASISMVEITSTLQPEPTRVHLVHAPGLYAPFPFANARPGDFLRPDTLRFADPLTPGNQVQCHVQTWFAPPADGLVHVEAPLRLKAHHKVKVTLVLGDTPGVPIEPIPDWLSHSTMLDVTIRPNPL